MLDMLTAISRFCSRFPWLVIGSVLVLTGFFAHQIREKAFFEADMTKFLPQDIPAVKSDDYYKKNFRFQDTVLIGLEAEQGEIMKPEALRAIEKIVIDLKELKATKTIQSKLQGKEVTIKQYVGIDPDTVSSLANLDDAILDKSSGSVISGSVIKKLKDDQGISSPAGKEEMLPDTDEDLRKIIPSLQKRVLADRNFRNSLLSTDLQAASIRVAMVSKIDYKKRFAVLELTTAMNPDRLINRFNGNDSTFPFEIYGRTIDDIRIDDDYINRHSKDIQKKLKNWLIDNLEVTFDEFVTKLDESSYTKDMMPRSGPNSKATVDYLEILDMNDDVIGVFTGSELQGVTIIVPGDTIQFHLVTDAYRESFGYKVVDVVPEPSSIMLLGVMAAGVLLKRRRQSR